MNVRLVLAGVAGFFGARAAGYEPLQIAIRFIRDQLLGSAIPF